MLNENLEFPICEPVVFDAQPLSPRSQQIHDTAVKCAKRYLIAEAELLEAIIQVDKDRTYEKFRETYLTPYCMKYLKLSDEVAGYFVRVARKSQQVPELRVAVVEDGLAITKARAIASVVTPQNQAE